MSQAQNAAENAEGLTNSSEEPTERIEEPPQAAEASTGTVPDGSDSKKNLMIAATGIAAVVVAGMLFLAPGDRVLGFDSDSNGIERSHDGDMGGFGHEGPVEIDRHGPGGYGDSGEFGGESPGSGGSGNSGGRI